MDDYTQGWIDALNWAKDIAGCDNAPRAIMDKMSMIKEDWRNAQKARED